MEFDREKFVNHCCWACNKSRQLMLDKIEQYKNSEPEMVKYLEWYRDRLWDDQVKQESFHRMKVDIGEEQLNKNAAAALRAVADKLEQPGNHFMIGCELPPMPVFSGTTDVDRYHCHISVHMVAGPLGG